jgi:hypothetical protein
VNPGGSASVTGAVPRAAVSIARRGTMEQHHIQPCLRDLGGQTALRPQSHMAQ